MPAEGDVTDRLCVILTGGSGAPTIPLPRPDLVIAADSGLDLAAPLGLGVDLIVGDFDSADPVLVAAAVARGTTLETHPADKDATDLDLALGAAARLGATRTIVIGGAGDDRIDHVLANAGVIASSRHAAIAPEWWVGSVRMWPTRGRRVVEGAPGDLVSIVPVADDTIVTTSGLRWPLTAESLPFGTSRGVSNTMLEDRAVVDVHRGVAMVAHLKEAR
jgi:thiamine pyrophosphokinase